MIRDLYLTFFEDLLEVIGNNERHARILTELKIFPRKQILSSLSYIITCGIILYCKNRLQDRLPSKKNF